MPRIWTVLANSNYCKIYDFNRKAKELSLVKELNHTESKLKGQDLISDKPGRYQMPKSPRSAYEPNKDPQQIETERFAHEIAQELEAGRNKSSYEDLVLILPPQMSGLIHAAINKNVRDCIVENIIKDYVHISEPDLINTLTEALRRPKE